MPDELRVSVPDARELRADLESLAIGAGRAVGGVQRRAGELVAPTVRALTPLGPGPRPNAVNANDRLPHIRNTIVATPRGVIARHPAALVHEYGGTISPNGGLISIRASHMGRRAGERKAGAVESLLRREYADLFSTLT